MKTILFILALFSMSAFASPPIEQILRCATKADMAASVMYGVQMGLTKSKIMQLSKNDPIVMEIIDSAFEHKVYKSDTVRQIMIDTYSKDINRACLSEPYE